MLRFTLAFSLIALFAGSAVAQEAPPVTSSVELQLLSPGAEPLAPLRYDLGAVAEQVVQMDMDTTMGMGMGGQTFDQAMPTIRTNAAVRTPSVDDAGHLTFVFSGGNMSIVEDPNSTVDPAVAAALASAISAVGEIRGTMVIDDRGNLIRSEFDLSDTTDPQMRQMLESTVQTAQQSVVPFPVEPVGVGARWSATMEVVASGMAIQQSVIYELVSLEGTTARIASTISQSADNQFLELPELPPTATAELVSHTGSGSGVMLVRLDRAMPTGTFAMNTESTLRYSAEGETADMSMTVGMAMRMEDPN